MDVKSESAARGYLMAGHPCEDMSLHSSMGMRGDFDDSFGVGSRPMTYQASNSSFSTASSAYDPFTPTSGRSTPHPRSSSMDIDCSFGASHMGFDLTPPPTATSTYFPMDLKGNPNPNLFVHNVPMTPTRYTGVLDGGVLPSNTMDDFGHQGMEMYALSDGLAPSPFMVPTPPQSFHGAPGCDMSSIWAYQPDSPITFLENQPSPPIVRSMGQVKHDDLARSSGTARRLFVGSAQQKTTALRRAQSTPQVRTSRGRITKGSSAVTEKNGILLKTYSTGKHPCPFPECQGKRKAFNRMEHLKRHIRTIHEMAKTEYFKCEYCNKSFSRTDNYRTHLELHSKKSSRTDYHPEAKDFLEKQRAGIKQRRPRHAKSPSQSKQPKGELESYHQAQQSAAMS